MSYRLILTLGFLIGLVIGYTLRPACPKVLGREFILDIKSKMSQQRLEQKEKAS
jgi:hypothetical protein